MKLQPQAGYFDLAQLIERTEQKTMIMSEITPYLPSVSLFEYPNSECVNVTWYNVLKKFTVQ